VIKFDNAAEAAGLAAQVAAFDGDGAAMARNMLLGKIAPSFRTILGNSEGPLMDLFRQFTQRPDKPTSRRAGSQPRPAGGPSPRLGATPTVAPGGAAATGANRLSQSSPQPTRTPVDTPEGNQP
jgi:hypothetical protein